MNPARRPGRGGGAGASGLRGALGDLVRRFDALALRPPAVPAGESALLREYDATAHQLLAWCHTPPRLAVAGPSSGDAGPASAPGMAVGSLLSAGGLATSASRALADALARQLDGSQRLEALPGRAAGLAWRLGVKAKEAMVWRTRQPDDPWDAGWLINSTAARQHTMLAWRPRRATLLLADATVADTGPQHDCLAALWQRQDSFRHPVRWLWVGGAPEVQPRDALAPLAFVLATA